MYKSLLLFGALFLLIEKGQAQDAPILHLRGIITDAGTGEVIPYATLRLAAGGVNTMSNEKGRFVFKIPAAPRGDSVYISHVGYRRTLWVVDASDTALKTIRMV